MNKSRGWIAAILITCLCVTSFVYFSESEEDDSIENNSSKPGALGKVSRASTSSIDLKESMSPEVLGKKWGLSGRVAGADGGAIGFAKVMIITPVERARHTEVSPILAETKADSEGIFKFSLNENPEGRALFLCASADGFDFEIQPLVFRVDGTTQDEVEVVLDHQETLGIVVGEQNQIVTQVPLILEIPRASLKRDKVIRIGQVTDEFGAFKCFSPQRYWGIVRINHPTIGLVSDENLINNEIDKDGRLVFELPTGGDLRVRFVSNDGAAIESEISFRALDIEGNHWFAGRANLDGEAVLRSFPSSPRIRIKLLSDEWFLAGNDVPGEERHLSYEFEVIGQVERATIIPVSKGTSLSGVVIAGDSDQPISNVEVECFSSSLGGFQRSGRASTDDNGRFHIEHVPSGWSFVTLDAAGFSIDILRMSRNHPTVKNPLERLQLARGQNVGQLSGRTKVDIRNKRFLVFASELTPQRDLVVRVLSTGSVKGQVVDTQGLGVRGVVILLQKENSIFRPQIGSPTASRRFSAITDEKGEFVIREVPSGHWKATCDESGHAWSESAVFEVRPKEVVLGVRVELKPSSLLTIKVEDESGAPIRGLQVQIIEHSQGTNLSLCTVDALITDDSGHAITRKLSDGTYSIELSRLEGRGLALKSGSNLTVSLDDLNLGEKRIVVTRAYLLRGRIVDEYRKPLRRGFVSFQRLTDSGEWVNVPYGPCKSNRRGEFQRSVTMKGVYRIRSVSVPSSTGTRNYTVKYSSTFSTGTHAGTLVAR